MKWLSIGLFVVLLVIMVGYRFVGTPAPDDLEPPAPAVNEAPDEPIDPWRQSVAVLEAESVITRTDSSAAAPIAFPAKGFWSDVDALRARANAGDRAAADTVLAAMRRCVGYRVPADAAQIEQRVESRTVFQLGIADAFLAQTRERIIESGGDPSQLPEIDTAPVLAANLEGEIGQARDCEGAGDISKTDVREALWLSARLGNRDAQLEYWHVAWWDYALDLEELARERDRGVRALTWALEAGDWRALAAISEILEHGFLAVPDPGLAYAYAHGAWIGAGASPARLPWFEERGFFGLLKATARDQLHARMSQLASVLDPAVRDAQHMRGETLYQTCCSGASP